MTAFIFFPAYSGPSPTSPYLERAHFYPIRGKELTSFTSDLWKKLCSHWMGGYTLALHSWPIGNRPAGKSGIPPWALLTLPFTWKGRCFWYLEMGHRRTFYNSMFLWLFQPQPTKWIINYILRQDFILL